MKIEVQWKSGAIECHSISQADGGIVVDAMPADGGEWAIKARSSYGAFVKHEVCPLPAETRSEYARALAAQTIAVLVDGLDFRSALIASEGIGAATAGKAAWRSGARHEKQEGA